MSNWQLQIEQDLSWREGELGTLKLLLVGSVKGSERQRALLRASCAMLYAHYEGFCKFCWCLLLDIIKSESLLINQLSKPFAIRAMTNSFRELRKNTSSDNLWNYYATQFNTELSGPVIAFDEIDTESNLWPNVAQAINASLGITCVYFSHHQTELKQLVGRRNQIAHGEKLEMTDLAQFTALENAVMLVMHDLAVAVTELLDNKDYLMANP